MKKVLKVLMIIAGIMLVLLIGAVITVKVMFPPAKVRAIVEKEASKVAKRNIQVTGASLSIFPTIGLEIKGIRVSNTRRDNVIQKPTQLWAFLASQGLKKRRVLVTLNGKAIDDPAAADIELKQGDKIRVSRKGFDDKAPMFALGRLFVAVKAMPLLQRKIIIQNVSIEKLKILVEVDGRGSYNFDDLAGSDKKEKPKQAKPKPKAKPKARQDGDEAAEPISLQLESFQIKDSSIIYRNKKSQQEIVLDDINQTLSASLDSNVKDVLTKGLLEIKKVSVRGRGIPVRQSGAYFMMKHDIKVDLKAGKLRINQFTVGFKSSYITVKGAVDQYNKPVRFVDLSVSTNKLRLHDLFREVPPAMFPQARKMKVKGTAQLSVNIKGKVGGKHKTPGISGFFKMANAYIKYADLPKAINDLNADMSFTMDSLHVKKFGMKLGTNPISLVAKVNNFKKPNVDVKLNANVDLGTLKDVVKLSKGTSAKGVIKANITAKGVIDPKNPASTQVNGDIKLLDVVATTSSLKKPVKLNGTFAFSNQEVKLDKLVGNIGHSSFTMNMSIKDYLGLALPKKVRPKTTLINMTMNAPLLDLNEMLGYSSKSSGSSKSSKSSSGSKSSSSSSSSSSDDEPISVPKLPDVVVNGTITVGKLQYKNLPITKSKITLTYKNKHLAFALAAGLFEGRINEVFTVNMANPKRLVVTNKLHAKKVEANDFISNFNDLPKANDGLFGRLKSMDNTVYGKMDFLSDVKTSGITRRQLKNNLDGDVTTKLYRGHIKNATILTEMLKTVPKLVRKFLPQIKDIKTRKTMSMALKIKKGKLHLSDLSIPTRQFSLAGYGTISLDSSMNIKLDMALSRRLSRKILRLQRRLQRKAGGLLRKVAGAQIAGQLGKLTGGVLIPSDKKGRVVPILGALGLASKLSYKFLGFKGKNGTTAGGDGGGDIGKTAKKMLKKQLDNAKKKLKAAAAAAKRRALQAAAAAKKKALKAAVDAKKKALKAVNKTKKKVTKQVNKAVNKTKKDLEKKKKDAAKKAKDALKNQLKRW